MPPVNQAADLSAPELTVRLHQQGLVAAYGRFALETDDLQTILDEASCVAADGLKVRFAKVLQCLPEEQAFLVRAGVGWKPGVVGHARVGGDLDSPAGYAFRTGVPVISNDLAAEPRFRTPKLLLEHGIRSAINVLVRTDGEDFGVLEVDSSHRGEFGESDVAFLQTLANTLAVAIRAQKREDGKAQMLQEKEALLRENERLLREKDLLVREIHHRVTNSLQLVHSALTLQGRAIDNAEARQQIAEAAARVLAIAAVNRRLYQAGTAVAADARQYMRGLLDDMKLLLPSVGSRSLELDMESFPLSADDLAHLGLIAVELVTNALKHGRGRVQVAVRCDDASLQVSVADEGPGFPAGFDPAASAGLGFRIVSSLAGAGPGAAIAVDRSMPTGKIVVRMPVSVPVSVPVSAR
jgi:two-component sensor histidine kinase